MRAIPFTLSLCIVLSACWEVGSDASGPYKAIFLLQDEAGEIREFYLGGYHSFKKCAQLIELEASELEGDAFWMNPEFDYGGEPGRFDDDWIKHTVLEVKCRIEPEPPT